MGKDNQLINHPDTMELAMVAEFLNSERQQGHPGMPRLLSHLAGCRECRAEVMELTDVLYLRGDIYFAYETNLP